MLPQWIIEKKRDGGALTGEDVSFFIQGYTRGDIPDYQMAALAMAIFFRGMSNEETAALTRVMLQSGSCVDTTSIPQPKIDKHSTGGIGDKVSLALAPLVAACGVTVPMIAGRGLGLTGGTLDKLEAIPGYRTDLSLEAFVQTVRTCGCSIIGQTAQLVPADRKLYALRDVTATVPSIPLIVASIMSKKLAAGLDGLVLDVKCGRGAFMRTRQEARNLAEALVGVGRGMGKRVAALITAMDQPLGRSVGNALEVIEAIDVLAGRGPADTTDLTLTLAAEMLRLGEVVPTGRDAFPLLRHALSSGAALRVFRAMVTAHGGNGGAVDDPALLPSAPLQVPWLAPRGGFVADVNAESIGRASLLLGAGRARTTDAIDPAAGLSHLVKIGEEVTPGATLAVLHAATPAHLTAAMDALRDAFTIAPEPVAAPPLILEQL